MDGRFPEAGLIIDSKGNLYGTTGGGGADGGGMVFELTPKAGGGWTEKVLHNFPATDEGRRGSLCQPDLRCRRQSLWHYQRRRRP